MTEPRIVLERGDITRADVDAIVNAANRELRPGGGVSGAIHAAGGPEIGEEERAYVAAHGALYPGEAAITTGGRLPARHVIHAVGPRWHGGDDDEAEVLSSAYRAAIALAEEHGLTSIALPSLSTGIFGYPVAEAALVAMCAVRGALSSAAHLREVRFVLFDDATYRAYEAALLAT